MHFLSKNGTVNHCIYKQMRLKITFVKCTTLRHKTSQSQHLIIFMNVKLTDFSNELFLKKYILTAIFAVSLIPTQFSNLSEPRLYARYVRITKTARPCHGTH